MKFALLGDLHSHYDHTVRVLAHIKKMAPEATLIGLGDLFECKISQKKANGLTNPVSVKEAAIYKKKFRELLTFRSIIGNQEERIAQVTGDTRFLQYPATIELPFATCIHGHQFEWSPSYELIGHPDFQTPLVFFGHSHRAAIYDGYKRLPITYAEPINVANCSRFINVGSIVDTCDWLLYDSNKMTVTYYQA